MTGLTPPDTDLLPPDVFVLVNNYPTPNASRLSGTFSIKCLTESTAGLVLCTLPRAIFPHNIFIMFNHTWLHFGGERL